MSFLPIFPTRGFFKNDEHYQGQHAIFFLSVQPHESLFRFAEKLASSSYHVYISVDDNNYTLPSYRSSSVKVLRYPHGEAEEKGYKGSVLWCLDRASSRCKALYFLGELNKIAYDSIWMMEDDVFVPSLRTISHLDRLYPSSESDLLSAKHVINENGETKDWHWFRNVGKINPPWAGSMISAIRISPAMVDAIRTYARKHKTLLFDEMMFNTLALHHKLTVVNPSELASIVFHHDWKKQDITEFHLYHPVKDMNRQEQFKTELGFEHYHEEIAKK